MYRKFLIVSIILKKSLKKNWNKILIFLKSDAGFVLSVFLVWRVLIAVIAYASAHTFQDFNGLDIEFDFGNFWNIWARWDGWHYVRNSINSYTQDTPFTAFFPLYPLLINFVSILFSINPIFSGLVISNLSLIAAGYFLIKLVKLDFSDSIAKSSFVFLLSFPSAIFLASVYTESLFLFLTISAFYFARTNKWLLVFLLAFLAALTRNLGVFLVIPLAYIYYKQKGFNKGIILASGSGFGLLTYMSYLYLKFGDPLKFVKDQAVWGREIQINIFENYFQNLKLLITDGFLTTKTFEFLLVNMAVFLIIYAIYKKILKLEYLMWTLLLFLPPIMQNIWSSVNRYLLAIFPIFIVISIILEKRKVLRDLTLISFSMLLSFQIALFVNRFWAG